MCREISWSWLPTCLYREKYFLAISDEMACSYSYLRQSLGIENANTVQRPALLEENMIFEIFYGFLKINYLLDLPPTDKNTGVALAITYHKLKEEFFLFQTYRPIHSEK